MQCVCTCVQPPVPMGAIVTKKSSVNTLEEAGNPETTTPPSTTRSGASTASVSSVGIPLPPRPPHVTESTPPSPTPPPRPTGDTQSESSASSSDSDSERAAAPVGVEARWELVEQCLKSMEAGFGVTFERRQLLDRVQEVRCRAGETLMEARQAAVGVYVVREGELEVLSPSKDVALCCLGVGDFCGELSSFFRIPCTAAVRAKHGVRTTVLLLPLLALSRSSQVEQVPMHRLLKWCTQRSYVSTADMLDKSKSALLSKAQIEACLSAPNSLFSTWSTEAKSYIATKSSPMLFSSGDVLCEAGEELSFYFLVLRGSVEVSAGSARPWSLTVHSSSEGSCIGKELFSGSRVVYTVTATSPLLAVPITLDLLKDTVNKFPRDAAKLKNIQRGL